MSGAEGGTHIRIQEIGREISTRGEEGVEAAAETGTGILIHTDVTGLTIVIEMTGNVMRKNIAQEARASRGPDRQPSERRINHCQPLNVQPWQLI